MSSFLLTVLFAVAVYNHLTAPPGNTPGPDLIKAAGLARSWEPMIAYAETGTMQVEQLQNSGSAVWELAESVRLSNMSSAPIMSGQLDELSGTLKHLASELTGFFASVNGHVDDILLSMEWAQRELTSVTTVSPSRLSVAVDNIDTLAVATSLGSIPHFSPQVHRLLGLQNSHHTQRLTLARAFWDFLSVLDDHIKDELNWALRIEGLFATIDSQFANLQHMVAREMDSQEKLTDVELATLWTRVFGISHGSARRLKKYEDNRVLLSSLRERTSFNRRILDEHKGRLLSLKVNLDQLKKRLSSPLMKAENTSLSGIQDQINGLQGTYSFLQSVRDAQKGRLAEAMYGIGGRLKWPEVEGR